VDQHPVRGRLLQHRFQRKQHPTGLLTVRSAADTQMAVGEGDVQIGEKRLGQPRVVVLASVHDHVLHSALGACSRHRSELDELRSGAHHAEYSHPVSVGEARGSGPWHPRARTAEATVPMPRRPRTSTGIATAEVLCTSPARTCCHGSRVGHTLYCAYLHPAFPPGQPRCRPMRVVAVTTWFPTAIAPTTGTFTVADAQAIQAHRDVTDLRVIHLVPPHQDDGVSELTHAGLAVTRIPMSPRSPVQILRAGHQLRSAVAGADVVHTMAFPTLLPMAWWRPRATWVHTEHWSGLTTPGTLPLTWRLALPALWPLIRRPDVVTAVCEYLAR